MADTESQSGSSNILREYLIRLGFNVDATEGKRFDNNMQRWDKAATRLSRSLAGVAVSAQVMVAEFAYRMEKLYYASKLAQTSATNLAALDFGANQIGVKNFTQQVQNLAAAVRANPGLVGLLQSLGVKVQPHNMAATYTDFIEKLSKMPFYVAQRYASMFGIDPQTLLLMEEGLGKMKEAAKLREDTARDMGIDVDKAAESGRDMMNAWRDVLMYVGLFKDALIIDLLPAMQGIAGVTKEVMTDWVHILNEPRDKFVKDLRLGIGLDSVHEDDGGGVQLTPEAKARVEGKTPAEQKIERDLPYHAPEGNVGIGKAWENFLRYRARRAAIKRGEMPDDEKPADAKALRESRQAGPKEQPDDQPYQAPEGNTGLSKLYEEYSRWRINRGRAQRGLPPLPEEAPVVPAAPAVPVPAPSAPASRPGAAAAPSGPTADRPATLKGNGVPVNPDEDKNATPNREEFLRRLEKQYRLPVGWLDRVWRMESGRGRAMRSPKGAEGPFGFMPATAKEYGIEGRSMDFVSSAEASARKFADLMRKYKSEKLAAAAYNGGDKKIDALIAQAQAEQPGLSRTDLEKYVLGRAPKESRDYADQIAGQGGVTINQENNITVNGSSDPHAAAREVEQGQRRINADTVRQFAPRMN